ncbi:MAG TPA: glycoside hydrolase family 18 protein [Candidatus Sulfotelmatobacter sp.]
MKNPAAVAALLISLLVQVASAAKKPHEAVIGYIFANRGGLLDGRTIAANKMTRINYAFFGLQNGLITSTSANDAANLATLVGLKKINPRLEIVVSVGGGGEGSAGFSDMAITPQGRRRFVESALAVIERYKLDGIDIDWEYPGYTHANTTVRPEDKQTYTRLLKELREHLDKEGARLGRHLITSSATGATRIWLEHTDMGKASKYLDSVNMMCYDWYNPVEKNTGHDSPLYTNPADPKAISIDDAVRMNLAAGVPAHKIVIGVPFYGRKWTGVESTNNGLFQPIPPTAAPQDEISYFDIAPLVKAQGYMRYWDRISQTPYLYNSETKTFITYNDPETELSRTKYVRDHHLGGIMFWQYGHDPDNVLLDAIDQGFGMNHPMLTGVIR